MGRILAIDYGKKRTGLAVTDPLKLIGGALATVPTNTLVEYILDYIKKEEVETIVVGEPRQLSGEYSESMKHIKPFVARLRKLLPDTIELVMYDERFTSTIAHQAMIEGGMKKSDRRDKSRVDSVAATLILTSYLDSLEFKNK